MSEIVTAPKTAMSVTSAGVGALIPQDIDQAFRLASAVHKAGLAPYGMDTPEKCFIAIATGLEIGVPPMQAIQGIAVIGNRPCVWGDTLIGVVRASPKCEWIREWIDGEGDDMVAHCIASRRGEDEPVERTFSVEDAKRAGLWDIRPRVTRKNRGGGTYEAANDSPWFRYPKRMLQMRARAWCLRDAFADVTKGIGMAEEARDTPRDPEDARDVTPAPAPTRNVLVDEEDEGAVHTSETPEDLASDLDLPAGTAAEWRSRAGATQEPQDAQEPDPAPEAEESDDAHQRGSEPSLRELYDHLAAEGRSTAKINGRWKWYRAEYAEAFAGMPEEEARPFYRLAEAFIDGRDADARRIAGVEA